MPPAECATPVRRGCGKSHAMGTLPSPARCAMQDAPRKDNGRSPMPSMVYITASGPDEADAIAAALVERRLAACVNVLGPIRSVYRWEGAVEKATEVALVAKTADDRVQDLIGAVRSMHSYDVPCIVVLPVTTGNPDFLDWIHAETR